MRYLALSCAVCALMVAGCTHTQKVSRPVVECSTPSWAQVQGSASPSQISQPALVGKDYGMAMTPIPLDAVQFTSKALAETLAIQSVAARRTPTDTVQVTSRVVNCTDKVINFLVRTSFMDANQVPAEPVSAWRTVIVQPRATALYQENSIGKESVVHYLIEVAPY
jgi:hypothetical protein